MKMVKPELSFVDAEGRTLQAERGDSVVGRTADEPHRPLVCFVCAKRFPITFNFCLEHKDEYERLKRASASPENSAPPDVNRELAGSELIAQERRRQVEHEGWSAVHDAAQERGELAIAAACYADPKARHARVVNGVTYAKDSWPWEAKWDKRGKHGRIHQLAIAGALIAAEIDRLLAANSTQLGILIRWYTEQKGK